VKWQGLIPRRATPTHRSYKGERGPRSVHINMPSASLSASCLGGCKSYWKKTGQVFSGGRPAGGVESAGGRSFLIYLVVGWAVLASKQAGVRGHDDVAEVSYILLDTWQVGWGFVQSFTVFRQRIALKRCRFDDFRVSDAFHASHCLIFHQFVKDNPLL
jgi:hypothetical protein